MKIITSAGVFDTNQELVVFQFDTNPEKGFHAKNIDSMNHDCMNYSMFPSELKLKTSDLKEFVETQLAKVKKDA